MHAVHVGGEGACRLGKRKAFSPHTYGITRKHKLDFKPFRPGQMVFNRKLKSAVKERRIKQREAKKRSNVKTKQAVKKVLVSGKRTGSMPNPTPRLPLSS